MAATAALALAFALAGQQPPARDLPRPPASDSAYVIGAEDQLSIWALGVPEISDKPVRVDPTGHIDLPMLGRVRAAGRTVQQLKDDLATSLKQFVREPQVSVAIAEFHSQPVSVIGAVKNPGVHQLIGRKTLVEVLSLAGGLAPEAGNTVKITRRREEGAIPLPSAAQEGEFSVAEVNLKGLMEASAPEQNIPIQPHDVVSVPRAVMVYVMGEVSKPGGFVLNERETFSVLQALSLAGGVMRTAAPGKARILRGEPGSGKRQELPLNLKQVLSGRSPDVPLQPEDILFVPNSAARSATVRALEAAIQMGTGVVIWRR